MRPSWIALLVAGACIAAPAPLAAQEPATDDAIDLALTPMFECIVPTAFGASIRLSTVRDELEAPTISAGVFLPGDGAKGVVSVGVGANMMVGGPYYVGAEAGALVPSLFRPSPTGHVRLGARYGEVGPVAEIRAGWLYRTPLVTLALGFRF